MKSIYVYGVNGHGMVVADIANACGYKEVIHIDDGENDQLSFDEISTENRIPIALGIGDNKARKKVYEKIKKRGFDIVTLVHPSATISPSAVLEEGTVVMPNVVINAKSLVGKGVIVNSSAIVEHENILEDFVHISPNVGLAGNVHIGTLTHVGIGSSVIQGLKIGKDSLVGAGSVVTKSLPDNIICYGNPCQIAKESN